MTTITQQYDLVAARYPCRDRVTVAYLPVKTGWGLLDSSSYARITALYQSSYVIHIAILEPGLFNFQVCLVAELACQYPVEFLAATERVLNKMCVVANPADYQRGESQ